MKLNVRLLALSLCLGSSLTAQQAHPAQPDPAKGIATLANGFRFSSAAGTLEVTAVAADTLRIDVRPSGIKDERTVVLDPAFKPRPVTGLVLRRSAGSSTLKTPALSATLITAPAISLNVSDSHGTVLLSAADLFTTAAAQSLELTRSDSDPIYGITGIVRNTPSDTTARTGEIPIDAGEQGKGGAPMFFTRHYAVLVDTTGGEFHIDGPQLGFNHGSRKELEAFIVVGSPLESQHAVADLTGHMPMPPRWSLGFLNSQWGLDETELREIVKHYRENRTPLDGFIMDFDWKAWGEDNYGEWRWNSTSGAGAVAPNKFPDGASGKLAADLLAAGVHLTGILKPRIVLYKAGTKDLDEAASYAQSHNFWYPGEPEITDYFSKRPSRDLNFNLPEVRAWYWQHLVPAFDAGVTAWWGDEADRTDLNDKSTFHFDSLQFFNMGRALYDGQRAHSDKRVFSINRNYFMGEQRYGYAEWSGDINTGTEVMEQQPVRMLDTVNLGEPHWSMDTGGFHGHPSNEVYARWMEFAAFVPIFRVHGDHNQKRQPWTYGPIAQAAAEHAIQLRYELMPTIYSAELSAHETGVGIVRPLSWIFPDDATASAQTNEWMFGEALLVAPILEETPTKSVYLPAGTWWEYASGKQWQGGQAISVPVDTTGWSDIPVFVRAGSIFATGPVGESTDSMHPSEITLDIFPAKDSASFTYYEDDGATYAYEKGTFFRQQISAMQHEGKLAVTLGLPRGSYKASVQTYLLRLHGIAATAVHLNGASVAHGPKPSGADTFTHATYSSTTDKFGPVTEVRIAAKHAATLDLR